MKLTSALKTAAFTASLPAKRPIVRNNHESRIAAGFISRTVQMPFGGLVGVRVSDPIHPALALYNGVKKK